MSIQVSDDRGRGAKDGFVRKLSAPPSNNHMLLVLPHHDRSPPLEIACDKMLLRRQKI